LYFCATAGGLDEALTRRLWVLEVFREVVVEGRGTPPIEAGVLRRRAVAEFRRGDLAQVRAMIVVI
jgi:hypothetical protein